ncbi:MAG TPA: mandelate racemase/muconate lactonizing enzyme family protein [Candidatus Binatia bacterium]|nr:mandelate racemase/muconate lactonizing enzyme family protein [Candidatus Binatia bacterium]
MKILAINTYPLILPVVEIYGGAAGSLEDCRSLIVCVETENGIAGWGEATQGRPGNTYETLETMEIMTHKYFGPALMGMDLEETGSVLQRLHQVRYGHPLTKAALETALLDALGKLYRVPLYRLLGGPYRGEIELVGGLGLDLGPESIGERAGQLKREGFHTFKIKIGGKDRGRDIERVGAVREKVGTEATIRVDGNAAYSFAEAREILTELTRFHLADAEQPLARGDLKSLAALRREVGIPIAAQESVSSPEDALTLLEEQAADLLKIKLTHIGGFQRGTQVAAIMGARGLPVVVGQGSACTTLLSAAEMHLHVVLKNAQPGGEMTGFLRLGEQDIFSAFQVTGGKVSLPSRPGLGIEVDKEKLARLVKRF